MKKNLLLIVIIALSVMNLIFSGIMMVNVMTTSSQTADLVGSIAGILNIELAGVAGENGENALAMSDIDTYSIPDSMTILLKGDGENSAKKYAIVSVVLYLDMTHEDYSTYRESLNDDVLKSLVVGTIESFTEDEFRDNTEEVYSAIVANMQREFSSEFVFKVAFSDRKIS